MQLDEVMRCTILRTEIGSGLHGVALPGISDIDEMGVCIEPPEYVIGLNHFEQYCHRDAGKGERSAPGDLDLVIYSLRKWASLAAGGNPTVLLLLFAPEPSVKHPLGARMQDLAWAFAAKSAARAFHGYLKAQKDRLLGLRGGRVPRRDDAVREHGFDTKYAGHMLRLGYEGVEFLQTGRITLPMPIDQRTHVLKVRRGEIALNDVLTDVGLLLDELRYAETESPLPDRPAHSAINRFLVDAYEEFWTVHGLVGVPAGPGRADWMSDL